MDDEEHPQDSSPARVHARVDRRRRGGRLEGVSLRTDHLLDLAHHVPCLLDAPMHDEPSRTLGQMPACEDDDEPDERPDGEADAPTEPDRQDARIEEDEGAERSEGGAEPIRPVDREVGTATNARRKELVDRRVDRGVFAADARAREEAEHGERHDAGRERREQRRPQIDRERHEEELLPPERIRESSEEERTEHRPCEVGAHGRADLALGQVERLRLAEDCGDGADQRHFEPVEQPRDPEGGHHTPVPSTPREPIEADGDVALDVLALRLHPSNMRQRMARRMRRRPAAPIGKRSARVGPR